MRSDVVAKIEAFFSKYQVRKYKKGQVLLLDGEETAYIYHLVSGHVKQYDVTYRGDEIILNIFKPPAFFPMSAAINRTPNQFILEAETDIEVRPAPVNEVVTFVKDNPDVLFDLLSRVYRGVDGLLARMTKLMAGSARTRLVHELLVEARRFGEVSGQECRLNISEKDLGARAGLSRETVSREISKLKAEGLLEMAKQGLIIKDLKAFEAKLNKAV